MSRRLAPHGVCIFLSYFILHRTLTLIKQVLWGTTQRRSSVTRPLHVQWTLNLGVDLQVPVVQAPIAIMFKTKCDRYGFVSESEKLKTPISSRTFQRVETAKQRKRRVALETLRSQKWLDMMKSSLLSHPKLTSRCWKGVRGVRTNAHSNITKT